MPSKRERWRVGEVVGASHKNTVGGGTHRWYQSERQAFKLYSKYAGFCCCARPRVGCASFFLFYTAV